MYICMYELVYFCMCVYVYNCICLSVCLYVGIAAAIYACVHVHVHCSSVWMCTCMMVLNMALLVGLSCKNAIRACMYTCRFSIPMFVSRSFLSRYAPVRRTGK